MPNTKRNPDTDLTEILIRPMGLEDLPAVIDVAVRAWEDTYPTIISRAQMDYMHALFNTPEAFCRQIEQEKQDFLLAMKEDTILGYASFLQTAEGEFRLSKIYVALEAKGQGIGKRLIEAQIARHRPRILRLFVNRLNFPAVNFYFKQGFVIDSLQDTDIGLGYFMNDYVMIRRFGGSYATGR
jgi:ribosomal protein S18 acetylase RimI-like enzyme